MWFSLFLSASSGIFTEKPLLGGTFIFSFEIEISLFETEGSPFCSVMFSRLLAGTWSSFLLVANSVVFGLTFIIIPEVSAKVFASSSKESLFSSPVFNDSMERVFFPLLAPMTRDFMRSFPLLFSASEKSVSEPPFQRSETVLSFTRYVYVPAGTFVSLSNSEVKKRSVEAVWITSTLNVSYEAFLDAEAVIANSSEDVVSLLLNGFSNE